MQRGIARALSILVVSIGLLLPTSFVFAECNGVPYYSDCKAPQNFPDGSGSQVEVVTTTGQIVGSNLTVPPGTRIIVTRGPDERTLISPTRYIGPDGRVVTPVDPTKPKVSASSATPGKTPAQEVWDACKARNYETTAGFSACIAAGNAGKLFEAGTNEIIRYLGGIFSYKNIFWFLSLIAWVLLIIAQIFMGWAAWWLDGALYYTMVMMGYYINHEVSRVGIQNAWAIVRDITNVFIIAGFIAVGISTILQVGQYAADKFLARLIIAALLVNFSYFIAGAVIDATNYVGVQIYYTQGLMKNECSETSQSGSGEGEGGGATIRGIGGAISAASSRGGICKVARAMANESAITSWDNINALALKGSKAGGLDLALNDRKVDPKKYFDPAAQESDRGTNYYFLLTILSLMGAVFSAVLGWVFMQGAFLLTIRFVALIFLLITSPLGIAGVNIPYIGGIAQKWWDALISQAIVAPVYLFLVAMGLTLVNQFSEIFSKDTNGNQVSLADAFFAAQHAPGQGLIAYMPIFLSYFFAVGSMYLAYVVASQIASSTGELKGFYGAAGKMATNWYKRPFTFPQRIVAPIGTYAGERLAGTRYSGLGRYLRFGSQYLGEVGTGKKRDKSLWDENNEHFDNLEDNAYAGNNTKTTIGRWGLRAAFGGALGKLKRGEKLSEAEEEALKHDIATMSDKDLRKKYGAQGIKILADNKFLNPEQLKKINESNAYSPQQKSEINKGYFKEFMSAFDDAKKSGSASDWHAAAEKFDNMTDLERELLLTERKELRAETEFYSRLKSDSFNSLIKGQDKGIQDKMRKDRQDSLVLQLNNVGSEKEGRDVLKRMSNDEKAKLDLKTVQHLASNKALTTADLRHLHLHGSSDVKAWIQENFRDEIVGPGVNPPSGGNKGDEKKDEAPKEEKK